MLTEQIKKEKIGAKENIYNFYSYNDDILRFLYKPIELEEPIGLNEIQNISYSDKIINFDVTNIVIHAHYHPTNKDVDDILITSQHLLEWALYQE